MPHHLRMRADGRLYVEIDGLAKLTIPARECGDVSYLVGHTVRVGRVVHDTVPQKKMKGVRFVIIEHDDEWCQRNGECSRPYLRQQLDEALECADELEKKAAETAATPTHNGPKEEMLRIAREIRSRASCLIDKTGEPVMGFWDTEGVVGLPFRARRDFLM